MANGFVDEYVSYASDFCDAPNAYHYFCALGTLAAVVARRCCLPFGVKDLHPNLWLLLVGSSGERKSSAIAVADYLLSRSKAAPIFPNEFSREALMEVFQKHGSGVFMISEYSNLMGIMRRTYNDGVIGFLTDIYDVPRNYRRETFGKGAIELEKPCPNIIAGTTPEYMKTSADEWFSGWGPRFLVIPGERNRLILLPPVPSKDKEERLLNFLFNARQMAPTTFYLPEEEMAYFGMWAKGFDEKMRSGHSRAKALGARLYASALKIAMLLQVSSNNDWLLVRQPEVFDGNQRKIIRQTVPLRMPYIQYAVKVIDALATSTAKVLWSSSVGKDPFAEKREKVLEVIRTLETEGEKVYYGRLTRMVGMAPRDLKEVLLSLRESGQITEEVEKLSNGRRSTVIHVVEEPKKRRRRRAAPQGGEPTASQEIQPTNEQQESGDQAA